MACGLFVAERRLLSSCGAQALEHGGSVAAARRLSCPGACGILVPRPGIEPAFPALEGGFLTTGPPGKSLLFVFLKNFYPLSFLYKVSLSCNFFFF